MGIFGNIQMSFKLIYKIYRKGENYAKGHYDIRLVG